MRLLYNPPMDETFSQDRTPVSLLRLLAAALYDFLLLFTLLFFASFLVVVPLEIHPGHELFGLYQAYLLGLAFIFYAGSWTHGGQTLGMRTWRFKVVNTDGSALGWKTALVRFTMAVISWIPLGLGYFWILFDAQSRSWHDIVSGTRLVRL